MKKTGIVRRTMRLRRDTSGSEYIKGAALKQFRSLSKKPVDQIFVFPKYEKTNCQ